MTVLLKSYLNRFIELAPRRHLILSFPRSLGRLIDLLDATWPHDLNQRIKRRFSRIIEEAVQSRYESSNHRTAKLINIDLQELGYAF